MDVYFPGTSVNVVIPLVNRSGAVMDVTSIQYHVVDEAGTEIVGMTALADFAAGSASATIVVPATANAIAATSIRGLRKVELFCVTSVGTVTLYSAYVLEQNDPLIVGVNSFQNYSQAQMTALDLPIMNGWIAATDRDRIAAMIDARAKICQLSFTLLNSNLNFGQDSLNFVPEGAYQTPYATAGRLFIFNGNLALLTADQYSKLPERFKAALRLAQVAECDSILDGDTVSKRREEGLMLESIGESRQMFRSTKPLDLPISKRALGYISQFVTFSKKIGRA